MTTTLDMDGVQASPGARDGDPERVRVTHVITGLQPAGAELMLLRLLRHSDRERFPANVIGLSGWGPVGDELRALGVPIVALDLRASAPDPLKLVRLVRLLRAARPDVVQTWIYQADVLGGLAARAATRAPVAWGLRGSTDAQSKRNAKVAAFAAARLARRVPHVIVSCSEALADLHAARGYPRDRIVVIPNGFDVERFKPDGSARAAVRAELGLPPDALLVGLLARHDPQKDHPTALHAARTVLEAEPRARFLLAGIDVEPANDALAGLSRELGVEDRILLLGQRGDVPRLTAALDVAISSSAYGEGFSNTVGEAMACGVPCVATDVGDSKLVMADTGIAVPPRRPDALAEGILELLRLPAGERRERGARARRRICEHFEMGAAVDRYEALYAELAGGARAGLVPASAAA